MHTCTCVQRPWPTVRAVQEPLVSLREGQGTICPVWWACVGDTAKLLSPTLWNPLRARQATHGVLQLSESVLKHYFWFFEEG